MAGLSSQHSSTCSGSSSWVLWRDEPSLYRDPRARRGRLCSALLAIAVILVVLTVLSIAGLAVYMGALRIDTNKPELVFDGSVKVTSGDEFIPALNNNNSVVFKEMALKYQNMIDKVYQRSQLRPAYKKSVVEKFENGSLVIFFRLYLDRRKIPRSFQNVEETARDILVNELISPRTAAFKNVEIDATSIFIKRFIDDIENSTKKKQPSGNRTLEIRNGVLRKPSIKSSTESTATPEVIALNKADTLTEIETEAKQIVGEAIPVIEGSVVVTRIKNDSSSNPLFEKSSVAKVKNNTFSSIKELKNDVKVPENTSVTNDYKNFNYAVNVTSDISIAETNVGQAIKTESSETMQNKKLYHVQNEKENATTNKYINEKNSLDDISGINEENGVIDQELSSEMLKDNKSKSQNQTLIKKNEEKEILFGSDQTQNPFSFKTNSYNERYQSQWNMKNPPTPSYTLNPPHLQTEEPWRPILPYYTKHSPKPVRISEYDDDIGTGVAEVVVMPPSALENSAGDQIDNRFSSRLGQPAPEGLGNKKPEVSSGYGSSSVNVDSQDPHRNDTISRVSLQVFGTGSIRNEDTSLLHTTSGGGIIVRKQQNSVTVSPPHTIPLTSTTSEPSSTRISIDNPFTVPELPILHQFRDVDAILKPPTSPGMKHHSGESIHGDFKWTHNATNHSLKESSVKTQAREPVMGTASVSILPVIDHNSEVLRTDYERRNDSSDNIKKVPNKTTHSADIAFVTPINELQIQNPWKRNSTNNITFRETSIVIQPKNPASTSAEDHQNFWTDARKKNGTNDNSRDNPGKIHSKFPNLGVGSVSPLEESQWIELVNVTTSVVKPQRVKSQSSSLHQDTSNRYNQRPLWGDLGYRSRPNYKIQDFSSVESSSIRTHVNKSTRIELTTSKSSVPLVTLIPVRSNSGVGRPLRPRPRLPHHRNQTDINFTTNRNETGTTDDNHFVTEIVVLHNSGNSQVHQSKPKWSHTTNKPDLNRTYSYSSVRPHVTLSSSNIPSLRNTYKFTTVSSLLHTNTTLSTEKVNMEKYKTISSLENNRSQYFTSISQMAKTNSVPLTTIDTDVKLKSPNKILTSTPISLSTKPTVISSISTTEIPQNLTLSISEKTTMPSNKFTTETAKTAIFTPSVTVTTTIPSKLMTPTIEKLTNMPKNVTASSSRKTTQLPKPVTTNVSFTATRVTTPSTLTTQVRMKTTTSPFVRITNTMNPTTQSKIIEIFTKTTLPVSPTPLSTSAKASKVTTESIQSLTENPLEIFPEIIVTSTNKSVSTSKRKNSSSTENIPNFKQEKNNNSRGTSQIVNVTKIVDNVMKSSIERNITNNSDNKTINKRAETNVTNHQVNISNKNATKSPLQINSTVKPEHSEGKLSSSAISLSTQLSSMTEPAKPLKSITRNETTVKINFLTTQTTPSQSSSPTSLLPKEEPTKSPKSTNSSHITTTISKLLTTQTTSLSIDQHLKSQSLSSSPPSQLMSTAESESSKLTMSHLTTKATSVTTPIPTLNTSYSTSVLSSTSLPSSSSSSSSVMTETSVPLFNEYIPVIIIKGNNQNTQSKNNLSKISIESVGKDSTSSYNYTTNEPLHISMSTEENKNRTKEIPRNQTHQNKIIASSSISYITNKNENVPNTKENLTSSVNKTDSEKIQNKTEFENENIENTTPKVIVLNTDVVTTTSIEISFGENKETTTLSPPKNTTKITTLSTGNSSKSVTMPSLFFTTQKIKETRRQPKMRDISESDSSMIEGQLLFDEKDKKNKDENDSKNGVEIHSDIIRHSLPPYLNDTTTGNPDQDNETKHVEVTISKFDPNDFNYSITFDIPSTILFKFDQSLNSTTAITLPTNNTRLEELLKKDESTTSSQMSTVIEDEKVPPRKEDNSLKTQEHEETSDNTETELFHEMYSTNTLSTLTEQDFSTADGTTTHSSSTEAEKNFSVDQLKEHNNSDNISVISEIMGTYTNFSITKKSEPTNTESTEMSDDELLYLLHLRNRTNNSSNNFINHTIISQDAMDALSKFANIHTNEAKTTLEAAGDDTTTENYFQHNITKPSMPEEEKLSTKAISSSSNNNHAGIPILTKIYNKAPQEFDDRVSALKSSSELDYDDLTNETDCSGNTSLKCGDGECISILSRCNQLVDCSDGADERDCTCADYLKAQFLTRKLCDGIVDCWDFSDENNCEWCTPGQFVCPNSQVCVDKHRLCDGSRDCPYGDDEKQCVTVAQNDAQAGDFQYSSEGYLMVRKQGRWGKLCLQNFDKVVERSQSPWEVSDLGRAVCKAMTYSDFDRVNRTVDVPGSSRADDSHYYELAYSSDVNDNTSQPRSSLSFQETRCSLKEVVHVSCRDLECGVRPQAINQWARIVGGGNAAPGAWPWQAALYKEGEFQCGATLIADRWLVSAGHCFYHALDDYWVARLGALRRGSSFPSPYEQLRPVSHIILHPGYVDTGFLNDISLLRLREPVQFSDFVRPVCLPPPPPAASIKDGRLCTVVGWGQLFEFGRIFPDTLQEVQLPIISTAECRKRTLFLPLYRVTDNMFCAGFDRGGRDACLGDSGGPLMCQEKDGRWSVYGVTSNGYGCARANRPGVYTKVANYVPWLQAAMAQQVSSLRDSKTQCKGHRCPLGECLPSTRVCNGFMECSDGSDEKDCW